MGRYRSRLDDLEAKLPRPGPVYEWLDGPLTKDTPPFTPDGRQIIYVSWKKTQPEDQLARKTPYEPRRRVFPVGVPSRAF